MFDTDIWRAHLREAPVFAELDESGASHGWAEVPHAEVAALECYREGVSVLVAVPAGAEPVLFRRRGMLTIFADMPDGEVKPTGPFALFTFIGYRVNGLVYGRCCYIDGSVRAVAGEVKEEIE